LLVIPCYAAEGMPVSADPAECVPQPFIQRSVVFDTTPVQWAIPNHIKQVGPQDKIFVSWNDAGNDAKAKYPAPVKDLVVTPKKGCEMVAPKQGSEMVAPKQGVFLNKGSIGSIQGLSGKNLMSPEMVAPKQGSGGFKFTISVDIVVTPDKIPIPVHHATYTWQEFQDSLSKFMKDGEIDIKYLLLGVLKYSGTPFMLSVKVEF